jgi:hypothetical protein
MAQLDASVESVCTIVRCTNIDEGTDPRLLFHTSAGAVADKIMQDGMRLMLYCMMHPVQLAEDIKVMLPQPQLSVAESCPDPTIEKKRAALRSGVGCWPGVSHSGQLPLITVAGGDAIHEVPAQRWVGAHESCAARHGGFVQAAQCFDNHCFSISPAEASAMDPQQRLLLGTSPPTTPSVQTPHRPPKDMPNPTTKCPQQAHSNSPTDAPNSPHGIVPTAHIWTHLPHLPTHTTDPRTHPHSTHGHTRLSHGQAQPTCRDGL